MKILVVLFVTFYSPHTVHSEAFFVSSLLRSLRGGVSSGGRHQYGRALPHPPKSVSNHFHPLPNKIVSPHRVKTKRPSLPPTQHKRPVRPVTNPEPFKLSYGGWKPIGFSEDSARTKHRDVIVTIDSAIAAAPEAESDDLAASAGPAVPPPYEAPAPVYVTPAARPAPAYDPSPMSALAVAPVPVSAPVYSPAPAPVILPTYTPAPATFSSNGGSPDSLLSYADASIEPNNRLTKDVAKPAEEDELFYLYYRDLEPKTEQVREAEPQHLGVHGLDFPLYDTEDLYDVYRPERDQQGPFGVQSSSSVSFNQNIGGQQSGFSYTITG